MADTEAFTRELSELCRKHGLGLTGDTKLFVMERDDFGFDFTADADSKLHFGAAPCPICKGAKQVGYLSAGKPPALGDCYRCDGAGTLTRNDITQRDRNRS
jgi:hypothetical protein